MAGDILQLAEDYTVATDDVELILGEPMRNHTSFRIGGSAEIFARPFTAEALCIGIELCRREKLPYYPVGKGSNLLVADRGIIGAVFDLTALTGWSFEGNRLTAACGEPLSLLASEAAKRGLSGLEFASGIPGSLGGALFMNAGAYGGEMKQVVKEARILTESLEERTVTAEELALSYRHSAIEENHWIVLSAVLELVPGEQAEIEAKMKELNERRREKQPLELPSAGSTFKRPEGYFAGKLIEEAGLRGFSVGGAQVSEKHCGFVVNRGGATARDVRTLCKTVQERVRENSGVTLDTEIRMIGEF